MGGWYWATNSVSSAIYLLLAKHKPGLVHSSNNYLFSQTRKEWIAYLLIFVECPCDDFTIEDFQVVHISMQVIKAKMDDEDLQRNYGSFYSKGKLYIKCASLRLDYSG